MFRSVDASNNAVVNGLIGGGAWGENTLTYSFAAGDMNANGIDDFNEGDWKDFYREIIANIESFTQLTFREVAEPGNINFQLREGGGGESGGPGPGVTTINSVVGINPDVAGSAAVVRLGTYSLTWFHETGHALGLKHTHEVSVAPTLPGVDQPADKGTGYLNSHIYTAMGYTFPFLGEDNPFTPGIDFATPLNAQTGTYGAIDIAALQYIYGARAYRVGDDVYRFNDDVDFNKGYSTIWDTGGQDTIEYVGESRAKIDLRAATLEAEVGGGGWTSTSETLTGGYTIAHGVTIENARGGQADDILIGNEANNVLDGGGGQDVLTGGGGADTFAFHRGQTNGDTVTDFTAGDRIEFHGFGAGATVTRTAGSDIYAIRADAAHGGMTETFQLTGVTDLRLGDYGLDRGASVILRDDSGAVKTWSSSFGSFSEDQHGEINVGNDWRIVGTSDFNGDGAVDLLWRHDNGTFTEWQSTETGFAQNVYVDGSVRPDWTVAATRDFDGDGKSDILWRHDGGAFTIWQSTGDAFEPNVYVDHSVGKDWHLQAAADFNGDGKSDLLWRHDGGTFTVWQSSGDAFVRNTYVDQSVGRDWHIVGTGDFNADGKSDLIFRNDGGVVTQWQSTGDGFTKNTYVDGSISNDWTIAQISDFNGDGAADLLWRNVGAQSVSVWQSTGNAFTPNTYYNSDVDSRLSVQAPLYDLI